MRVHRVLSPLMIIFLTENETITISASCSIENRIRGRSDSLRDAVFPGFTARLQLRTAPFTGTCNFFRQRSSGPADFSGKFHDPIVIGPARGLQRCRISRQTNQSDTLTPLQPTARVRKAAMVSACVSSITVAVLQFRERQFARAGAMSSRHDSRPSAIFRALIRPAPGQGFWWPADRPTFRG